MSYRILEASDNVVRKTLMALCEQDRDIMRKAVVIMDKLESATAAAARAPADNKRKAAPEFVMCTQCREAFTEAENSSTACHYHDEQLELNWDEIDDVFDVFEGDPEPEVEDLRDDNPECCIWSSCGGDGEALGCKTGWHASPFAKRTRKDRA